jgi:cytochrome c-type biogenesis protein CcmH
MPERSEGLPLWGRVALPLVVLAVALVIGSGVLHGSPETQAQQAAAIDAVIRCPSCTDVSVAQSNESTALAVRHEVRRLVSAGQSVAQIEQALVAQYGPSILLEPPDSAGFALIWIIPIVLGVGTLAGIAVLFWRRSRQFAALRDSGQSVESTP